MELTPAPPKPRPVCERLWRADAGKCWGTDVGKHKATWRGSPEAQAILGRLTAGVHTLTSRQGFSLSPSSVAMAGHIAHWRTWEQVLGKAKQPCGGLR